jgi:hypothetical protein
MTTTTTERPELTEAQKQRTAEHLVRREVIHCVSTMVSAVYKAEEAIDEVDSEELLSIMVQDDWATPAADHARTEGTTDDANWIIKDISTDHEDRLKEVYTIAYDANIEYTDEQVKEAEKEMRRLMAEVLNEDPDAAREYCDRNNLYPEQNEAYEHWAVSSWFAGKLADKGEMVGELFDFHIWGRCTTGQSIALDSVIQAIALEMWPEGWTD